MLCCCRYNLSSSKICVIRSGYGRSADRGTIYNGYYGSLSGTIRARHSFIPTAVSSIHLRVALSPIPGLFKFRLTAKLVYPIPVLSERDRDGTSSLSGNQDWGLDCAVGPGPRTDLLAANLLPFLRAPLLRYLW